MSPANKVSDSEWETVVEPYPETFVFENAGDSLQGRFLGAREIEQTGLDGNPRVASVYTIQDAEGRKWGVWGNYNIDAGMEPVAIGDEVYFEFQGKVPIDNGARTVNQFVIKFRKG